MSASCARSTIQIHRGLVCGTTVHHHASSGGLCAGELQLLMILMGQGDKCCSSELLHIGSWLQASASRRGSRQKVVGLEQHQGTCHSSRASAAISDAAVICALAAKAYSIDSSAPHGNQFGSVQERACGWNSQSQTKSHLNRCSASLMCVQPCHMEVLLQQQQQQQLYAVPVIAAYLCRQA